MEDPSIDQMCAFGNHFPILAGLIARTSGNILELGIGHYSTPLISFIAKATGRTAVSVDIEYSWINFFKESFKTPSHEYIYTNDELISTFFLQSPSWKKKQWDVAFIDCRPEYDRVNCVNLLRDNTRYIIAHDTEPTAKVYKWDDIFDTFPYKYYYDFYGNGTTVVSMKEDCSWLL